MTDETVTLSGPASVIETLPWCINRNAWADPETCWGQTHQHYDVDVDERTGKAVIGHDEMTRRHAEAEPVKIMPPRLPGSRYNRMEPDSPWPWGPVVRVHEVGPYAIVEYLRDCSNTSGSVDYVREHGATHYSTYVDGVRTGHSRETLDGALAHCIAYRHDGINTRADGYFLRGIGAPERDERADA